MTILGVILQLHASQGPPLVGCAVEADAASIAQERASTFPSHLVLSCQWPCGPEMGTTSTGPGYQSSGKWCLLESLSYSRPGPGIAAKWVSERGPREFHTFASRHATLMLRGITIHAPLHLHVGISCRYLWRRVFAQDMTSLHRPLATLLAFNRLRVSFSSCCRRRDQTVGWGVLPKSPTPVPLVASHSIYRCVRAAQSPEQAPGAYRRPSRPLGL